MKKIRFVGLDVHAETIAVAVAEPDGLLRPLLALFSNNFNEHNQRVVELDTVTPYQSGSMVPIPCSCRAIDRGGSGYFRHLSL